MNCSDCNKIVATWESGAEPEESVLKEAADHIAACSVCGPRYRILLEFMKRDGGRRMDIKPFSEGDTGLLKQRVLSVITDNGTQKPLFPLRYVMRAAVLLIAAGLLLLFAPLLTKGREDSIIVHFELNAPEAESVMLVGDFSDWDASRLKMKDPDRDGTWEINIKLRKQQIYTYNFLIDGEKWVADPSSDMAVEDGFGGINSVISL